ncbi:hypothetical protein DFH07DRAFT_954658 [Mycena maculata]|uniref:Uncharacterized protein n=1 Tax=Mycena maculata TaxID=230809 RepID=A0AAD7NMJ1_9AGAR|nr:hypothetical protein DFH07DRAFT_954658 [Mycena maculata]
MATKNLSSHAACNPTRQTQPTRTRTRKSSAATNSNGSTAHAEKARVLTAYIELHFKAVNETIQSLAVKHGQKAAYIKKLLTHGKQFKQRHANNIRNAIMHDLSVKAKKAGEDSDLQTMLENLSREEYEEIKENLTPEERKRIMKQLDDHTRLKRTGIRRTNRALAQDASQTASGVGDVLVDLFERTGVRSCCLFSRSSATDAALPAIQDSDNSRDFFQHALGKGFFDILLKFEQWSCTRDTEAKDLDDVQSVRKQIVLLILEGKIKNKKNVDMDYVNYKVDVMHKFGVELAGWPSDIPFERPVKLTADQGREIRDGLRSGAIRWVVMTKSQREELAQEIEELGGVAALKRRKMRSDKGKSRKGKGKANNSDSEDEDGEDGEGGEDDEDGDDEDNEDDEDEEDEDEEIPQRKSTAAATASSRSKCGADTRSRNSTATASSGCKSGMGAHRSGAAAASRMSPASGVTPVAVAAAAGTNPTPSSTAALLTNLIPTAVLTNDILGTNTVLGVPASAALTHDLAGHNIAPAGVIPAATGPTTGAMDHAIYDFYNGVYDFDYAVYNFDFTDMDLTNLSNLSTRDADIFLGTNGGRTGGHADACVMPPLPYTFPPVDSLAGVMGSDLYGMPPLPNSFGVYKTNSRRGPDGLGNAYDLPRLPNPNAAMHEDSTLFEPAGSAASTNRPVGGVLEEATNMEQAPLPAKKLRRDATWTAVTFGDDAQPKGKRKQSRKKKDAMAA